MCEEGNVGCIIEAHSDDLTPAVLEISSGCDLNIRHWNNAGSREPCRTWLSLITPPSDA